MWYFLFGKKVCPRCGGKLIRRKSYETIHGHMPYIDDVSRIDRRKVKHYLYSYSVSNAAHRSRCRIWLRKNMDKRNEQGLPCSLRFLYTNET